jgi:hypothetical protein
MVQRGFGAKVRGIYATALSKLLLNHGFELVQPSIEIVERLKVEPLEKDPDVTIQDRHDRQGVEARGSVEAVEALGLSLREDLVDVILRRGVAQHRLDVEFPWASKMKLDEYREAVAPTVQMHHFYKACGDLISSAADMAENLLLKGRPLEEVEELLKRTVDPYLPSEGSEVDIEHVKLSGSVINLGRAVIEEYDGSVIRFTRELRSAGVYDGLEVQRGVGDRAVTEAKLGDYYMVTKYYSKNGRFKGAYINLNTPVEVYPAEIRYVDLEADVCVWPGGDVKVIDKDLLERAALKSVITDELFEMAKAKAEELAAYYAHRPIS